MYILKNAIKNLGRNKGRNILMGIILFAIILTTAIAIIINTTTVAIIEDYKARFGSEVTIDIDFDKVQSMKDPQNEFKRITGEQYFDFGESEFLQSKEYKSTLPITFEELKALDEEEGEGGVIRGGAAIAANPNGGGEVPEMIMPKAYMIGTSKSDISDDFKRELRKIIDGKVYENIDECIVSENFAELNNLVVGDTIKVNSIYKNDPMTHELTVVGIYEDNTSLEQQAPFKSSITNRSNEILTDINTAIDMEMFDLMGSVEGNFYLKEPGMISDFQEELKEKGLPDYYSVSTDEVGYKKVVGPVEGLAKISVTFTIAVLVLGSIILIILSTLAIRERKYEIGVLRAMGMKKGKVALGIISEMIALTIICLTVGLSAGVLASQPTADAMLQNQIEIAKESEETRMARVGMVFRGGNNSSEATPLSEVEISLNNEAILKIVGISLFLAGISSVVGIGYITKYEPMKILSERS